MTKQIILSSPDQVDEYIEVIYASAEEAAMFLNEKSGEIPGIELLRRIKFEQSGYDPLDNERRLNLLEQVNQSFTYLASFNAAKLLFEWHAEITELQLNLGTQPGSDIESKETGLVAAEVFAATSPNSNRKLKLDVEKVLRTSARNKYVFFECPGISRGRYMNQAKSGVTIWSLADAT